MASCAGGDRTHRLYPFGLTATVGFLGGNQKVDLIDSFVLWRIHFPFITHSDINCVTPDHLCDHLYRLMSLNMKRGRWIGHRAVEDKSDSDRA